jgi:hypothetical protein
MILIAIHSPAVNTTKLLSDWEPRKVYELLLWVWQQAYIMLVRLSSRALRDTCGRLTRGYFLVDDEESLRSEPDRFWALDRRPLIAKSDIEIIAWWRANKLLFPILSRIAVAHLLIPATSASVERQFSKARLMSSVRCQSMREARLSRQFT